MHWPPTRTIPARHGSGNLRQAPSSNTIPIGQIGFGFTLMIGGLPPSGLPGGRCGGGSGCGLLIGVGVGWITFGAHIHSTVHEFEPAARIGWYGETDEWLAYHTWLLEPRDEETTDVVMEKTGTGANPRKLARSNPGHMHRGHELWNVSLKFLCEG